MSKTKICRGYKKPAHEVPISGFSKHPNTADRLQTICRECANAHGAEVFQINRKRHPITGVIKNNWKRSMAKKLGGEPSTPEWQSYLDKAETIWDKETKNIEAEAWLNIVFPTPPKDDLPAAKAARKRTNLEPLDKLPPEGWVYIIAASRHASIMKIGSTFENGIRDRLSEAKRWALAGSAVLLHKEWFSRCKQAESLVHKRLDYCRIVSPDAGDELFRTSFEHALANVMIIKNEVENDREEQEVG